LQINVRITASFILVILLLVPFISKSFDTDLGSSTPFIKNVAAQANSPPVANAMNITAVEDTPATITLSGSDTDLGSGTLAFSIVTNPANGTLGAIAPNNTTSVMVTYTPNVNFNGNDTFTFRANDGIANSNNATIFIMVTAVNDAPIASAGVDQTVTEGMLVALNGTATDPDSSTFTYSWTQTAGIPMALSNATIRSPTFTAPQVNATVVLIFQLRVNDGLVNGTDTVNITVNNVVTNPISFGNSALIDQLGNTVAGAIVDVPVGIKAEVKNSSVSKQTLSYIVLVKDSDGITLFLTWIEDLPLPPNESAKPAVFWTPDESGSYEASVFVWKSIKEALPLSSPLTIPINVT
jgi:hypothetical protein